MRTFATSVPAPTTNPKCDCCNDCHTCHLADKGICDTHAALIVATR